MSTILGEEVMDLSRPLGVVSPTLDGDVLAVLARADAWFTTGQLQKLTVRFSDDGIRRALRRLTTEGVVLEQPGGNAVLYRLNREHLAAPAIVELSLLRETFIGRARERLDTWRIRPKVAVLFGSAARGTMTSQSDIDIFLVRPVVGRDDLQWEVDVDAFTDEAGRWTGNDVRVLELSEDHVRDHAGEEPVLADIVDEGVPLAGDFAWLTRLVRRASSRG